MQRKWQATWCSPWVAWVVAGRVPSAGTVVAQIGWGSGQRGGKREPAGGVGGVGWVVAGGVPSAGTVVAQIGWAIGQRVWKRQPAGGLAGLGGSPWSSRRRGRRCGVGTGADATRISV